MPDELKDREVKDVPGVPQLSISEGYSLVYVAKHFGMTADAFSRLGWDEQAKLIAYCIVEDKIQKYYAYVSYTQSNKK